MRTRSACSRLRGRTARLLDASAQMVRRGARRVAGPPGRRGTADAFARDAGTLRSLLGENDTEDSEMEARGAGLLCITRDTLRR